MARRRCASSTDDRARAAVAMASPTWRHCMEAGHASSAMPDQSSAADEHAILQEITAPLATLPDDPMPEVADVAFSGRAARLRPPRGRRVRRRRPASSSPSCRRRVRPRRRSAARSSASARRSRDPPARPRDRRGDHRSVAPRGRGPARGGPHEASQSWPAPSSGQGPRRRHRPDLGRAPADRRRHASWHRTARARGAAAERFPPAEETAASEAEPRAHANRGSPSPRRTEGPGADVTAVLAGVWSPSRTKTIVRVRRRCA